MKLSEWIKLNNIPNNRILKLLEEYENIEPIRFNNPEDVKAEVEENGLRWVANKYGVSEKDLMKEYQLSSFCHGEMWGLSKMNEFVGRLKSYDGVTIQEKAVNYLLSTGVTSAEIANIREIFLGK